MADLGLKDGMPQYWEKNRSSFNQFFERELAEYAMFSDWFSGDMRDVARGPRRRIRGRAQRGALSGMQPLVTSAMLADLFWRAPQFLVEPDKDFMTKRFTPELAQVETRLLMRIMDQVNLYGQGRRVLTDMLLGHIGIFKVGFTAELVVDAEYLKMQRDHAREENDRIMQGGRPRVNEEEDHHTTHNEEHKRQLAAIQRKDIPASETSIRYLKKHIEWHDRVKGKYGERSTETTRESRIFVRRRCPLRFYYDPWAEDPSAWAWTGEAFLRPLASITQDKRYDEKARNDVRPVDFSKLSDRGMPISQRDALKTSDDQGLLFEFVNNETKMVTTYALGSQKNLRHVPYHDADIMPSGPYIVGSFVNHPVDDTGVPPPRSYQGHQENLAVLSELAATIARRAVPKLAYDANVIDSNEIEEIRRNIPAGLIPIKGMKAGRRIDDVIKQIPTATIPAEILLLKAAERMSIQQLSGMGGARLGDIDQSKTATASTIMAESVGTLAGDRASVVDDLMTRLGRAVMRLARRHYTNPQVGELIGEDAITIWPSDDKGFTQREILDDRGVTAIFGSSRQNNSAVRVKLLTEAYAIAKDTIAPSQRVELLERIFEAHGIHNFDFTNSRRQAFIQEIASDPQLLTAVLSLAQQSGALAAIMGQGPGQAPQNGAGGAGAQPGRRPARRATESRSAARGPALGGVENAGGGRLPTGASAGDRPRLMR